MFFLFRTMTEYVYLKVYIQNQIQQQEGIVVSEKREKTERVLGIYTKLMRGDIVNKAREAKEYGVDEEELLAGWEEQPLVCSFAGCRYDCWRCSRILWGRHYGK